MYSRPLAGICLGTALFICAANGAPTPPAEGPPPADGALSINGQQRPLELSVGDRIEVSGDGFAAEANVTVAAYSAPTVLDEFVATDDGTAVTTIEVPDLPGAHTLVMIGNDPAGGSHVLSLDVTIAGPPDGALPATGTSIGLIVATGIGAVLLGAAALRGARIRGRSAS
jgi:hypothetical protein